ADAHPRSSLPEVRAPGPGPRLPLARRVGNTAPRRHRPAPGRARVARSSSLGEREASMTESRPDGSGLVGKVQTVLGPISSESLGVTMTHEHVLVDLSPLQKPPVEASKRGVFYAPLTMDLLGRINFGGHLNLDNSRLVDVDTAIAEAMIYHRAGGQTIVEA